MNYNTFIDEIVKKYDYQDNVRRAIEIALPLMIKKYGEHRLDDIFRLFRSVEICSFSERTPEAYEEINEKMLNGLNTNINDEAKVNYGLEEIVPGSTYSYHTIFDQDMNITGEKCWISIEAVTGKNQAIYEEMFGTNINVPYFLHELGHAFAMQNPVYKKEGNRIYSKHGFYEKVEEISYEEEIPTIKTVQEEGLLVEDIVNEKMTKDQLMDFFGLEDVEDLKLVLKRLPKSSNVYGGSLHFLAEQLEFRLGTKNILKWRVDNDSKVRENFSSLCNATEIASVYFKGEDAYSFFSSKVHEIYVSNTLAQSSKISIEEYGKINKLAFYDAMAVICSYREAIGEKDFSFYDEQRKQALPPNQENYEENKTL